MYEYIYIEADCNSWLRDANYREIIDNYSRQGWRFVSAIPKIMTSHGVVKSMDLVFEKLKEE